MKRISLFILALFVMAAAPMKNGYEVGDTVADFRLKNTDEKIVALSDFRNSKGVIVIFDCNTCPYSKAYNGRIIALNDKYAPMGYPVIAINPNDPAQSSGDSFEANVEQARQKGYRFPYLTDEPQVVTRAFGATNTPHVFVLQRAGNEFKVAYIGAIDDSARDQSAIRHKYVEDAVDALLQGKPVPTAKTKAIGCSVKLKNS